MERGLYIAASGMLSEMVRQDQIANDLANASTPGYKSDRATQRSFGDMLLANSVTGLAQTAVDFSMQQSVYQSALHAGANIVQQSLLDFLR